LPFNQPATNNYFGFQPVQAPGTLIQCNPYAVSSSEASDINIGDVVCQTSIDTVRVITGAYTPTSSMATVGVAASFLAANTGSTAATIISNTSQMLLVYDGPGQIFAVCDTTSASAGLSTQLWKNYPVLSTGCIGSTGANGSLHRSVQAISGTASTAAGAFHVLGMHPCEMGIWSSGGGGTAVTSSGVRKYIGFFNTGVTVVSTSLAGIANTTS
jgi:hypothetical protein